MFILTFSLGFLEPEWKISTVFQTFNKYLHKNSKRYKEDSHRKEKGRDEVCMSGIIVSTKGHWASGIKARKIE